MYKDDPFGDLGRLEAEVFRAARLVVDTGLHAQRVGLTTRRSAILLATTGMNESEVITEVERYMGLPGQACAYKVGQLKILNWRERAKTELVHNSISRISTRGARERRRAADVARETRQRLDRKDQELT